MKKGIDELRRYHTASIKNAIITDFNLPKDYDEFGKWDPPLDARNPTTRGFHHDQIGALLVPTGMDWNNDMYVSSIL